MVKQTRMNKCCLSLETTLPTLSTIFISLIELSSTLIKVKAKVEVPESTQQLNLKGAVNQILRKAWVAEDVVKTYTLNTLSLTIRILAGTKDCSTCNQIMLSSSLV